MKKSVKITSTGVDGLRPSTSRKAQSGQRRPLENLSLVDVNGQWSTVNDYKRKRQPSTVDVDQTELFMVDGRRQPDGFITPIKLRTSPKFFMFYA